MTENGNCISSWGDGNVLKLDGGEHCKTLYTYSTSLNYTLKIKVNSATYKRYLNKAIQKNLYELTL